MRTYPSNSPEAAARIVALTMLADGHVCRSEMRALDALHAGAQLQLTPEQLQAVLRGLSEDLLACAYPQWAAPARWTGMHWARCWPKSVTRHCAPPRWRCAGSWHRPTRILRRPRSA